ncbi:unnamed protein product [Callosobruchus maculatus]|uniref:Uncharacterized protein n=1 Tax=Callosobruchus maculatus TaxID=64391 RepID=A0A653DET8_CALMS|nr:unnamed protein product [Callosobruchus maculatus]
MKSKYPDLYKSFKVSVPADMVENFKDPEIWPKHIAINRKHSLEPLDTIQKRIVRPTETPNPTKALLSLKHLIRMAGMSLFYRFYHGRCSSELSEIIIPKAVRTRNSREALRADPYQVEVPTP